MRTFRVSIVALLAFLLTLSGNVDQTYSRNDHRDDRIPAIVTHGEDSGAD